jgi:ligand-binding sensor domain-containing protein
MYIWIACIVFLLQSCSLFAQNGHYNFSKLNKYNGLSNNQVNAILKDPGGFLWFGTTSGLNRYDGFSFKIYRKKPNDSTELFDDYILSLYELPNGKMWVATRGGPFIYDSYNEKFDGSYGNYLQTLGLPSGNIGSIVKGGNGRYWFLYDSLDLYVYSSSDHSAKSFGHFLNYSRSEKIAAIKETTDGKLWLVYQNGFLQLCDIRSNKVIFSSTVLQQLNKGNIQYRLLVDNQGDLWVWAFTYGVYLFQPQSQSIKHFTENSFPQRLNSNQVTQVIQDNNGLIWVATDQGGVTLIDKSNDFRTSYLLNDPKDARSLSQNAINALYKDDNGIIWMGTYKQGVNYLNGNIARFPLYHHMASNAGSLQYDDVNCFVEDRWGNIWIGTNGGGLIYFDRKNNSFRQYLHDPGNKNSLSNNVIVTLCIDHTGILCIGTYFGGLNRFDGKKFTHYRHNINDPSSVADDKVWEIFEDRQHNLWIGTLGSGLDRFDRNTNRFEHFQYKAGQPAAVSLNYISAILQDRKGDIWIGTVFGIAVLEKNNTYVGFYYKRN